METDLTLENTKSAKTHGLVMETGVLVLEPLGMVAEAPGVCGFGLLTVRRLFSVDSKTGVT